MVERSESGDESTWLSEDELLLADLEGIESVMADKEWARARRQRTVRERQAQLLRICDAYFLGHSDAGLRSDQFLVSVLSGVMGHLHDTAWQRVLAEACRDLMRGHRAEWQDSQRFRMTPDDSPAPLLTTFQEAALFQPDSRAISGMSLTLDEARSRARTFFERPGSGHLVGRAYPNPFLDLWLFDTFDPDHPDDLRLGNGPIVVPTDGSVYMLGSLPPHPPETVGMITHPSERWT